MTNPLKFSDGTIIARLARTIGLG